MNRKFPLPTWFISIPKLLFLLFLRERAVQRQSLSSELLAHFWWKDGGVSTWNAHPHRITVDPGHNRACGVPGIAPGGRSFEVWPTPHTQNIETTLAFFWVTGWENFKFSDCFLTGISYVQLTKGNGPGLRAKGTSSSFNLIWENPDTQGSSGQSNRGDPQLLCIYHPQNWDAKLTEIQRWIAD